MCGNAAFVESPPFLAFRFPPNPAPSMIPDLSCSLEPYFFRQTKNLMSYIWLGDRVGFWVFPVAFEDKYMHGYFWNGIEWVFGSVLEETIYAFF